MKIIIEKEIEVELPNGFYWDASRREGYWVAENDILLLPCELTPGYFCAELISSGWISDMAKHIWHEVYKNPDREENKKLEAVAEVLAEFYELGVIGPLTALCRDGLGGEGLSKSGSNRSDEDMALCNGK
jgi:hypothetical protein